MFLLRSSAQGLSTAEAELAQHLELPRLATGSNFTKELEKFAASPNRRLWLSLLAELATEPALVQLVAEAQTQVQQRATRLAQEKQAKRPPRKLPKPPRMASYPTSASSCWWCASCCCKAWTCPA